MRIRQQLEDFGVLKNINPLMCDNTSAMNMTKNLVHQKGTMYIDVRHHFLRDNVAKGNVVMRYCMIKDQIADIVTKEMSKENFFKNILSLRIHKLK